MPSCITRGLVVAGTHSGVGKTTVALGLMAAFRRRGMRVQPFKVGPDFIDPGHHSQVARGNCHNLDGWMLSRGDNHSIFQRHAARADLAVVEGVMGLFDGYDGSSEAGSTAQMAKWLDLPVLLVVDAQSMARSAAALVHGFTSFDRSIRWAGVVFNRIGSETHLRYLQQAMVELEGIPCIGGLPRDSEISIPERHLGLVTGEEHPLGPDQFRSLADVVERHLDLEALLDRSAARMCLNEVQGAISPPKVRIGVARDCAFCFYYPENLELLADFGAELVAFSPIEDRELSSDLDGLYLGGGYPEVFSARLAENQSLRESILQKAEAGMPIYAECGGLMYLSEEIQDLDGQRHAMAGVMSFKVRMLPRLRALGYREVTLMEKTVLGSPGTKVRGHEFHYSEIVSEPRDLKKLYKISSRERFMPQAEGYSRWNVLASYIHLHFTSNPEVARQFIISCCTNKETR